MKITLKLLSRGEKVLSFLENQILIQTKSGEARVIYIFFDKDGIPRVDKTKSLEISFGKGEIEIDDEKKSKDRLKVTTF